MSTVILPPEPQRSAPTTPVTAPTPSRQEVLRYLSLGILCGVILIKSEVASWYRIQEMLRFQGFHMFGFFFCAAGTGALSLRLLNRYRVRTPGGEAIRLAPKVWGRGTRYLLGGLLFGLGWGVLNACPGPIYALIGSGVSVMVVALASVLAGTWAYGWLRPHLPH